MPANVRWDLIRRLKVNFRLDLAELGGRLCAGLGWLRIRYISGCCTHSNEHLDVIKREKFHDYLRESSCFKKDMLHGNT